MLGDIALFGRNCINNSFDVKKRFQNVAKYLQGHDVVIGNLEAPFIDGHSPVGAKSAYVAAQHQNVELLRELNITHLTLANNHIFDFGKDAYDFTKQLLDGLGIQYFGIESREVKIEFDNNKLALSGYCSFNTNPQKMTRTQNLGVNILDVDDVVSRMTKNHNDGYLNILSIHSGQEHVHMPSRDDIRFARYLADKMPYIYYGHHPHVIQGAEVVHGAHIFYSLGNFIFDDVYTDKSSEPLIELSEANKTGVIVSLVVDNNLTTNTELVPIYLGVDTINIGMRNISNFSMSEYNKLLALPANEYASIRQQSISNYISGRKQRRDFHWYIKRLNINSVIQIANARKNAKLYKAHFSDKLTSVVL